MLQCHHKQCSEAYCGIAGNDLFINGLPQTWRTEIIKQRTTTTEEAFELARRLEEAEMMLLEFLERSRTTQITIVIMQIKTATSNNRKFNAKGTTMATSIFASIISRTNPITLKIVEKQRKKDLLIPTPQTIQLLECILLSKNPQLIALF